MVDLSKQWPRWPSGQSGFEMIDIVVDKSLEDLFYLLYGSDNDFRVCLTSQTLLCVDNLHSHTSPQRLYLIRCRIELTKLASIRTARAVGGVQETKVRWMLRYRPPPLPLPLLPTQP
jgi:hypothetical protein